MLIITGLLILDSIEGTNTTRSIDAWGENVTFVIIILLRLLLLLLLFYVYYYYFRGL